jgi:uncharacterized oligopeptide transporter (OPT) family protein
MHIRRAMTGDKQPQTGPKRFLPPIGSPSYHLLLAAVSILILGPLGGISASFMNFKIGFFVGGQVLAGILGSTVTLPYGPEGKHGANYIQTMSASVAGMCGMAVLVQAMVWLKLPEPPIWQLILYYMCIGMFGVGVGMLYTPILVDKMQLNFPSGFAVANILRALTDKALLRRSVSQLGGGMFAGAVGGLTGLIAPWKWVAVININISTLGAGMIVGARIAVPALLVGLIGWHYTPYLESIGWLQHGASFRKIGFIIALGTILGAAILDVAIILFQAVRRFSAASSEPAKIQEDWKRVNVWKLVAWVAFWGVAIIVIGSHVLHQPVKFLIVAVGLSFLFVLVNGISLGISDSNPISSAFVMTVFILAAIGLTDAGTGLLCASIMLIACSEGGDMQQDRSTGWRLGTNRIVQFRYQVIGIAMGAVLAVALAKTFMNAFPVLQQDLYSNQNVPGADKWQSAMTFKFVGALKGITERRPEVMAALKLGLLIGLVTEILRKLIKGHAGYKAFATRSRAGRTTDFVLDTFILPSPYASSFGGFVELVILYWWAGGGVIASLFESGQKLLKSKATGPAEGDLPADMSTTSLVGGGLIAGDALASLGYGIFLLLRTMLGH